MSRGLFHISHGLFVSIQLVDSETGSFCSVLYLFLRIRRRETSLPFSTWRKQHWSLDFFHILIFTIFAFVIEWSQRAFTLQLYHTCRANSRIETGTSKSIYPRSALGILYHSMLCISRWLLIHNTPCLKKHHLFGDKQLVRVGTTPFVSNRALLSNQKKHEA